MEYLAAAMILAMIIGLLVIAISQAFKIGYYEQTLKNNRHLFSPERFAGIERVMRDFWIFLK